MEKWQREHITKNLARLVEDTTCDDLLLIRLETAKVLGKSDVSNLTNTQDEFSRNMKLYKVLPSRKGAYNALINALRESNQLAIVDLLEEGIPPELLPQTPPALSVPSPSTIAQPSPTTTAKSTPPNNPAAGPQFQGPSQSDSGGPSPGPPLPQEEIDFVNNERPLEVLVQRPQRSTSFPDDQYHLPHNFKGYALVLNITEFQTTSMNRAGATLDTDYMSKLWTQLGYKVTAHQGFFTFLDVDRILEEFKSQFTNLPNSSKNSCVIFIGSHGSFSNIETSDHKNINLYRHVIYKFDSENCPQLDGKPKLFLIQACQRFQHDGAAAAGPPKDRTEADSILQTPIDDAIVCFATIPGYVANRDVYLGTWYTYCLAKVIMEEAHRMDLLKMLKKTQELMRNINANAPQGQLSTYLDLGIKTVYFNMEP